METSKLEGLALDWAVAKCRGVLNPNFVGGEVAHFTALQSTGSCHYTRSWHTSGPLIEQEKIELSWDETWSASHPSIRPKSRKWSRGTSPLIAAMRCYVASKLGDEVEIPEELK
jgi:hypothetical protein